ncbi:MarR family winged helix-turn-helix transcriptional regulator [Cohnella mopanensis]|uniref:MarR family winged helix-turn-helix transcriptional regulator n=1 Tax=Cohnella mopanensis TaxID=2911966 RepID=UPI001EF7EA88|nr:MarR family transcriptional regulator [Cohnella mopanensis]
MGNEHQDEIKLLMHSFEKFARLDWHKHTMFGLKPSEIKVLLTIKQLLSAKENNGVTVSEISNRLAVTSPTVTQIIKRLQDTGCIEKTVDSQDRRIASIRLTEKGLLITKRVGEQFAALFTGLIAKLGQDRSNHLIDLLNQVYDYLDKVNKELLD